MPAPICRTLRIGIAQQRLQRAFAYHLATSSQQRVLFAIQFQRRTVWMSVDVSLQSRTAPPSTSLRTAVTWTAHKVLNDVHPPCTMAHLHHTGTLLIEIFNQVCVRTTSGNTPAPQKQLKKFELKTVILLCFKVQFMQFMLHADCFRYFELTYKHEE